MAFAGPHGVLSCAGRPAKASIRGLDESGAAGCDAAGSAICCNKAWSNYGPPLQMQRWDDGAALRLRRLRRSRSYPPAKAQFVDNNGVPALVLPVRLNSRPE